jgi:hypothetical protein
MPPPKKCWCQRKNKFTQRTNFFCRVKFDSSFTDLHEPNRILSPIISVDTLNTKFKRNPSVVSVLCEQTDGRTRSPLYAFTSYSLCEKKSIMTHKEILSSRKGDNPHFTIGNGKCKGKVVPVLFFKLRTTP